MKSIYARIFTSIVNLTRICYFDSKTKITNVLYKVSSDLIVTSRFSDVRYVRGEVICLMCQSSISLEPDADSGANKRFYDDILCRITLLLLFKTLIVHFYYFFFVKI